MGYKISDPSFYQELKWSVVDAFRQLGYIRLPVEPSELLEAHGIQTLAYQIAYDPSTSLDDLMMLCKCPSGISFTIAANGRDFRFIGCNLQESPGRVRFTKLHEAGHLLRGHLQDSELAEIEANFWAKYAIAPPGAHRRARTDDRRGNLAAFRHLAGMRLQHPEPACELAAPSP